MTNGRDYRDHYYRQRALARSHSNRPITLNQAASQIGVSPATLRSIRQRSGIATVPQFDEIPVATPYNVLAQVDNAAGWAAGRQFGRWAASTSGSKIRIDPTNPAALDAWVSAQIRSGAQVTAQIQTASLERPATPDEIAQFKANRAEKRSRPRISYKGKLTRPTPRELAETLPAAFTEAYINAQLKLTPDYESCLLLADAIKLGATIQLFPESTPLITALDNRGYKTGNNYPADTDFLLNEDDLFGDKRRE